MSRKRAMMGRRFDVLDQILEVRPCLIHFAKVFDQENRRTCGVRREGCSYRRREHHQRWTPRPPLSWRCAFNKANACNTPDSLLTQSSGLIFGPDDAPVEAEAMVGRVEACSAGRSRRRSHHSLACPLSPHEPQKPFLTLEKLNDIKAFDFMQSFGTWRPRALGDRQACRGGCHVIGLLARHQPQRRRC
jgi:hypothetical protein